MVLYCVYIHMALSTKEMCNPLTIDPASIRTARYRLNLALDTDFEHFSKNFDLVYPNFFNRLQERCMGNLTQLDLRYCAYIHMGLSAKEISTLLNIDTASIRKARYRLKQKLNLGKEEDLSEFIRGEPQWTVHGSQ